MHPPVRLVAIDMDGTLLTSFSDQISQRNVRALRAAQQAGITVAIATGRRTSYTAPLLEGLGMRADMPLITSNGAVVQTLSGEPIERNHMSAEVARGLSTLLRPYGALVFTFDRPGRSELMVEELEQLRGRIALWVEANRSAIEVVERLEDAMLDGESPARDPIQGMVAGGIEGMRMAEEAVGRSPWARFCEVARTEYREKDIAILDLLPRGVSKGRALESLAARLGVSRRQTMAIGDNWNDVSMLEWAGQPMLMSNATLALRSMGRLNGWRQAPPNDQDGVAQVLEAAVLRAESAGALARIPAGRKSR